MTSGRLVAASTMTPFNSSIPSISVRRLRRTRSLVPLPPSSPPLAGANASISSYPSRQSVQRAREKRGTYEEDDGRSCCSSFTEQISNSLLRLSHILIKHLLTPISTYRSSLRIRRTSGPLTAMKLSPPSVANAFAMSVLLHPGGP
jgi:hypothetical protein